MAHTCSPPFWLSRLPNVQLLYLRVSVFSSGHPARALSNYMHCPFYYKQFYTTKQQLYASTSNIYFFSAPCYITSLIGSIPLQARLW